MNAARLRIAWLALSTSVCACAHGQPGARPAAPAHVALPAPPPPPAPPSLAPRIDDALRAAWQKAGVDPAPAVDDARFLRRVTLDITGTIPTPEAVTRFVSDRSADKRQRVVDELLASPRYADHWTDYWESVLLGNFARDNVVDRLAFRAWLHDRLQANTPWNEIVRALITATGINRAAEDDAEGVNAAVNYLLQYQGAPQDLSGSVSRIFLGVQIQCAQCHDHKTEKWTQSDFRSMTAVFARTRPKPIDNDAMANKKRFEIRDLDRPAFGGKDPDLAAIAKAPPRALDGTDFSDAPNRRDAFAGWMTSPQNPWFSRAIVNRIWSEFFGRGFVEPIDDFRPSNPPALPELLDLVARDFAERGYDLKALMRALCTSHAYELASGPSEAGRGAQALWSRHHLDPVSPDVLLTAIIDAGRLDPVLEKIAGGNVDQLKVRLRRQFSFLFDVDDEAPSDAFQGTISQALMLLNGLLVNGGASDIPGTALGDVLAAPGTDADKIRQLYLRTLSREPTDAERDEWVRFVNEPRDVVAPRRAPPPPAAGMPDRTKGKRKDDPKGPGKKGLTEPLRSVGVRTASIARTAKQQAYEDVFWALLNSSEFFFNH